MFSGVLLFLNIGGSEMIFIFIVALFLFGGDKLPEIARGLGKGIRDFKDASEGVKREIHNQINNYEEKRVEEEIVKEAEIQKELPPAVENTDAGHNEGTEHETQNHVNEATGVPNTIQYVEHSEQAPGIIPDSQTKISDTASETESEPVKTTHV
jgi:sec-independent protein translocase protein TatA